MARSGATSGCRYGRRQLRRAVRRVVWCGCVAGSGVVAGVGAEALGQLPAFPGADGAGAFVSGGRGGVVYRVTRLDSRIGDNGIGTLQYGVNDANFRDAGGNVIPRTIVFDVGGTIWLGRNAGDRQGWDTVNQLSIGSNVTIAGQTAPGGVFIAGGGVKINGSGGAAPVANTILRNVTLAPGYGMRRANSTSGYFDTYTYDALNINSRRVMVDHVSAVFATDETISCNELSGDSTVQYTNMSQGQNYPQADAQGGGAYKGHAMGSLWAPGSNARTTLHHNLYAHVGTRVPAVQTNSSVLTRDANGNFIPPLTDFRNNVIYNWLGTAGGGSSGQPSSVNMVNNYYRVGPGGDSASGNATDFSIVQAAGGVNIFSGAAATTVFQTGSVRLNLNGTSTALTNANFGSSTFRTTANGVPYLGQTDSAAAAFEQVLGYVGANWQNRSFIDARIVAEARNGTGRITALNNESNGYTSAGTYARNTTDTEWNRLLAMRSTTNGGTGGTGTLRRAADWDTDADGMPDVWERAMGLSPTTADNNGLVTRSGFTNLEEYLNELAAWPAGFPLSFSNGGGTQRFAEVENWATGIWRPSRFDEAVVTGATSVIDVPGQHAGLVRVASGAGTTGTLRVTDGWLDVTRSIVVGSGGSGELHVSGGVLRAGESIVLGSGGGSGSLMLTAGVISTPLITGGLGGVGATMGMTGGTLRVGTLAGSLTITGGTLSPGSDEVLQRIVAAAMPDVTGRLPAAEGVVGTTQITGDLMMSPGAVLAMQIGSALEADRLRVDGRFTLGGVLQIELIGGYRPPAGTEWLLATSGQELVGSFTSVTEGFAWRTSGGSLMVMAIPEPAGAAMVLLPLAAIGVRRRRR